MMKGSLGEVIVNVVFWGLFYFVIGLFITLIISENRK